MRSAVQLAITLRELAEELRPISYRLPVDAPVVRPFEPHDPYGPGHRGVDLDARAGMPVRAAERGRVGHAGQVAGVVWVSVDHEDGIRTSYGPLTALHVAAGDDVARGDVLGLVAPSHHGDPDIDRGLHLGARRDGAYLDPMRLPGIVTPPADARRRRRLVGGRPRRHPLRPVGRRVGPGECSRPRARPRYPRAKPCLPTRTT